MWLLEEHILKILEQASLSGMAPTAEQQQELSARISGNGGVTGSRILEVTGNTANIKVEGVLTQSPDFLAMLFGGGNTTYAEIIAAIAEAENDTRVEATDFHFDTPGGSLDGLFDTVAAMQLMKKPSRALVSNKAASAGFALASQTDEIVALNRAARIGSVGIVQTFRVSSDMVEITSTEAPRKRPDVTTEEGQGIVREDLDALHELFADSIATGRNTTVEKVNSNFGQGATLLAGEALKRGMIDSIADPVLKAVGNATQTTAVSSGGNQSEANMDLNTLKAQHPDVFAAAVQTGVDKERDRVSAHLIMGEKSGAMKTASDAIKNGDEMTATLQATYMTAGMNRNDVDARSEDDESASGADGAQNRDEGTGTQAEMVADLVESKLGTPGE